MTAFEKGKHAALMLALAACFGGCEKKVDITPALPPPVVEEVPTTDQALAAVARFYNHSKRVCYDADWGYFLDYGKPLTGKEEDDGMMHGNYLIQNVKFHKSSNGTFFIDNIPDDKMISVSPDLNALPCKAP